MQEVLQEFKTILETVPGQLLNLTEPECEARPSAEKWSKKEILGHLIDSASNNHQRFVRGQLTDTLTFPPYEQNGWARVQQCQSVRWEDLVQLWKSYNTHLLHLMSCIPEEKLNNRCIIGDGQPLTLEFLMRDYVRHLKHHLEQIFS